MSRLRRILAYGALAAAPIGIGLAAGPAKAACNTIPAAKKTFRAAIGTIDTAFGSPDGVVDPGCQPMVPECDPRNVEVAGSTCGEDPKTLSDENDDGVTDAKDYVVTVIFEPTRGTTRKVVALTAANACPACDDGQKRQCVTGGEAGIQVSTAKGTLHFRFPDTSGLFPKSYAGALAGPATIAVTPSDQALPCQLANRRCQEPGGPPNLFACVDELFATADCETDRSDLDLTFPHFTALPLTNDWQKECDDSQGIAPPCTDQADEVRFAVDQAGNALLPVDWSKILADEPAKTGKKKNRVVTGRTKYPAFAGNPSPVRLPSDDFLGSFTPRGTTWSPGAPEFKETPDPSQPNWLVLSGEADEAASVLRIARRELWAYQCQGGPHDGEACHPGASGDCGNGSCVSRPDPSYFSCQEAQGSATPGAYCTRHSDCPSGQCLPGSACVKLSGTATAKGCKTDFECDDDEECGLGIFEFRDRPVDEVGPIEIPEGEYKAKAGPYKPKP
jgi:hypothetical protein